MEHRFNYNWTLKDANFTKDKGKVFSCFACGGGSTMGYKLAGFDVIGCNEIDPKMNKCYVTNHNPKFNYLCDIRELVQMEDLPEELYNLDILDGSPPCFEAGTLVKTINGYKKIEDITIGDVVFTHQKRYNEVYNIMNKNVDEYYNIKIQGCIPFNVTKNHPFYVRKMQRKGHNMVRTFTQPEWIEVQNIENVKNKSGVIKEQYYVGLPIIQEEKIPQWNGITYEHIIFGKTKIIKKMHNLDLSNEKLWYFIGRYIGDGWLRDDRREVILCCGKLEKEELIKLLKEANLNYSSLTEQKSTYRFTISNVELYEYIKQFGKGASGKHLTKDIFELPKKLLESFLDGYLSADGFFHKKDNTYKVCSVSKELIFGIQQCIAKCYHQPTTMSIKKPNNIIEGRIVNAKTGYTLSFRKKDCKQQHFIYEDGYLWLPFRKKELIKESLTVYNFSVKEDESYTVYNYAVHNCSVFSVAGSREDAWGVEKKFREGQKAQVLDTLFFDFIALAKKLKPKVVVAENVKGLILGNAIEYVKKIHEEFDKAGYYCEHFLLNGSKMGVPQKRERVFFLCIRKDIAKPVIQPWGLFGEKPVIKLDFNEEPITCRDCNLELSDEIKGCFSEDYDRLKNGEDKKYFQSLLVEIDDIHPTIVAGYKDKASPMPAWEKKWLSKSDLCKIGSYPQDYDFGTCKPQYLIGMSVPPIMTAQVATEIYEQWLSKINK